MASSSPTPRPTSRPRKRARLLYEHRISLYCFLVALPGLLVSIVLVWMQPWSLESRLGLIALELFAWWLLALALQEQTTRPLQTLSNVIGALREEDYSFRARNAVAEDALGELSLEVNALADMLSDEKIRAIEATALAAARGRRNRRASVCFRSRFHLTSGKPRWRAPAASVEGANAGPQLPPT